MTAMTAPPTPPAFWDRLAERYSRRPVTDPGAYAATLDRVRAHLSPGDRVLEVGCGTGTTALKLADAVADYTASDYAPGMIAIAEAKLAGHGGPAPRFVCAPADAALPGAPFDAILGFNLLHLVEDLDGTLAALRAQIRPGGRLITKTPSLKGRFPALPLIIGAMRLAGRAPYVAVRSAEELEDAIRRAGFRIVETGDYPKRPANRLLVAQRP